MPAQDGAGWLLRLFPYACTLLLLLESVLIAYSLWKLRRGHHRLLNDEERILLIFAGTTVLPAFSALIGIAGWFACDSFAVGLGAAISFYLCPVAHALRD